MIFNKNNNLIKDILIVDGQPGCGKTMFNRIFNSFHNIEIYKYSSELENMCSFYRHKKITFDAAKFFIETYADENLYSQMMGRNTNFRYSDLSSVFQSSKKILYLSRLFKKGDENIPSIINKKKPILHFATHNIISNSAILFETFPNKIKFINIVRHPVYMVHQQAINHIEFEKNSARQLIQTMKYKNIEIPALWHNEPEKYISIKNPYEKAIHQMHILEKLNKISEKKIIKNYKKRFLKISFDDFVLNPNIFIKKIENFLKVKFDKEVYKTMEKEKIPRKKLINGRHTSIYEKYGWKRGNPKFTEREEIDNKIKNLELNNVSKYYLSKLKKMSYDYENQYLKNVLY